MSQASYEGQLRQQTALAKFGELALQSDDLDKILTEACVLVGEALGTDLAKVMELQPDGLTLLVRAGVGWNPGVVGVVTLRVADNTSEGLALKTHEPMISPDIATETRFAYPAFLMENGVKAVANVVIIGGAGRPAFGVLQVDSRVPRQFTASDTDFLRSYANLLAAAVDRLRVINETHDTAEQLRLALDAGKLGRWELDWINLGMNRSLWYDRIFGYDAPLPNWNYDIFLQHVVADDRKQVDDAFRYAVARRTEWHIECRINRADDNSVRWIEGYGRAIGKGNHFVGVLADITERVDREQRIRQGQRIETVGRLTAGVAHDFNNILQVLLGGLELSLDEVADQPKLREDLELALQAARRGARLTSHLLSFSRQQILQPAAFDVGLALQQLEWTLHRTLGVDITVVLDVAPDLPFAFADAAHLDSALLNLALNARDAMPQGGVIGIEARASAGHLVIAVCDSGEGMSPEVLSRACEPFFSTKGVRGSGLGLSMVQGFARQSGGELRIRTTPGQGTCVEIVLLTAVAVRAPVVVSKPRSMGNTASVLVVDDDSDVAKITALCLRSAGFAATVVDGASDALAALGGDAAFDALVTDLAMVGMSGAELVMKARALQHDLPALIVTGYAGAEGLKGLPADVEILRKPFMRDALVGVVQRIIEAGGGARIPDPAAALAGM